MQERYLEVTYRKGKPFAAYLYFARRSAAKGERNETVGEGLIVDYDRDGSAMGIEITAPGRVSLEELNAVLARLGQPPLTAQELAPLAA